MDAEGAGRCWEVAADAGAAGDAAAEDDLDPQGGGRTPLVRPSEVHGILEVLRMLQLNINLQCTAQTGHE